MAASYYTSMKLSLVFSLLLFIGLVVGNNRGGTMTIRNNIAPIAFNATVSKQQRPGIYNSLTEALAAAPTQSSNKYFIHVEAGVYIERVVVPNNLTNIVLVGDGADKTKIQWNRHAPEYGTSNTATLTVDGDGFIAKYITFENTAGPGSQAVAVLTSSNQSAYYKCTFLGYQDTLWANKGKQFYKECDIYSTVDYIFGAAAAVFQSCNLYARFHQPVVFTVQNKDVNNASPSGFVIQDCRLTVAARVNRGFVAYFGRPWSNYSTVVVMESYIDNIIEPSGWLAWDVNSRTDLVTYREFNNRGPGAITNQRVRWEGYEDLSGYKDKVRKYTVHEFINHPEWLHGTGIPYSSGFMYSEN